VKSILTPLTKQGIGHRCWILDRTLKIILSLSHFHNQVKSDWKSVKPEMLNPMLRNLSIISAPLFFNDLMTQ